MIPHFTGLDNTTTDRKYSILPHPFLPELGKRLGVYYYVETSSSQDVGMMMPFLCVISRSHRFEGVGVVLSFVDILFGVPTWTKRNCISFLCSQSHSLLCILCPSYLEHSKLILCTTDIGKHLENRGKTNSGNICHRRIERNIPSKVHHGSNFGFTASFIPYLKYLSRPARKSNTGQCISVFRQGFCQCSFS